MLIVSPEQIVYNSGVVSALEMCGVKMLVFDEAHTWLTWPSWRPAMARAPGVLRCVRRLAMTATLRCSSAPLLQEALGMAGSDVARHCFFRANLALRVEHRPPLFFERGGTASRSECDAEADYRQRRAFSLAMDAARHNGNAINYVHTRRQSDDLAGKLQRLYSRMQPPPRIRVGIFSYHAGRGDRQTVEAAFAARRGVIVVATVAFGLGINSPAVRVVVHMVRVGPSLSLTCSYLAMRAAQVHFETLSFLVRDANPSQTAPDSLEMYSQQFGRSGRDGQIAVCLLFLNPADLGPLRRAATRAAVSFADVKAAAGVVLQDLGTSSGAMMEGNAFTGRGIQLQRVDGVLRVLGMASYVAFEQAEHAHCSMRRGPNWLCPPATLSANAAYFLYALLRPLFTPGSTFARCAVADIASSDHFAQLGMGAARASVRAADELATSGVIVQPVEWRGLLFPVARLCENPPSGEQLSQAWSRENRRQQSASHALEEAAVFLGDTSCLYSRLCILFGGDDESDLVRVQCRCYVCRPAWPTLDR